MNDNENEVLARKSCGEYCGSWNKTEDEYYVLSYADGSLDVRRFTKRALIDALSGMPEGYLPLAGNKCFTNDFSEINETTLLIIKGRPVVPVRVPVKVLWDIE